MARESQRARLRAWGVGPLLLAALWAPVGFGCQSAPPAEDEAPQRETAPDADAPDGAEPSDGAPGEAAGRESLSPPGVQAPGGVAAQVSATELDADRQIADHYFRVGKKYFQQLDYQKAYDNLKRALSLDPTHADARELYREAGAILGVRQEELETNLERWSREQKVKIQLLRQQMIRFFEAGEQAFNEGDFEQSIKDFERVVQIVAFSDYEIDPGSGEDGYRERARQRIAEAKQLRLEKELEERDRKEEQFVRASISQVREKEERDRRRVQTMLDQVTDLLYQHRYKQAKELVEKVLDLEPRNKIAKKLRQYAIDGIHFLKAREIHENQTEQEIATWWEVEDAAIPQEGTFLRYPGDWPERTRDRRAGTGTTSADEPAWIKNFRKILRDRQVTLNFNDAALEDVILFLQDITGLNFVISPEIDPQASTVTLRLKDIKLENALGIILEQVGLTYIFDKESIIIIEPGSAVGEVYFDIYDVSDLLFTIKDFKAPRMSLPDPDRSAGGGPGGGSLIFGEEEADTGEAITGDTLAEIIIGATGGDDVWSDPMQIEPHKGQLLVTATRDLHLKVLEVLEKIRRNQGWFVHIETRFIEMTNDMLEDFGVDFRGLGGNPGDETTVRGAPNPPAGQVNLFPIRAFTPTTQDLQNLPNAAAFGFPTNQLGTPSDIGPFGRDVGGTDVGVLKKPQNVAGGFGRNFGPGLDNFAYRTQHVFGNNFGPVFGTSRLAGGSGLALQVAKLDPFQVNAILRMEYQSEKVSQLTAPRVTAANRERVYVSVVTQRAYISDWDLISGGTGLTVIEVPDPIIETLQEGVVLEVRPTISSDRKYVTLDCRPSLAVLVGGQIDTVIVNLGAVSMAAISVPIGVPEITLQEAFTSVTLPDGGTALLGGFRQINEQKEESSLPFVDNVPLLNVFFRRKSGVSEMRSLVILVTAKILNIRDEETKLFNQSE